MNSRWLLPGSKPPGPATSTASSSSARRSGPSSCSPRAVATIPPRVRTSRSSPKVVRSRASAWLIADGDKPSRAPARVTLRSLSIASSATSKFRSIAWS